jgi:hypothetical protein
MHIAVRGFMPQILGDPILPGSEHRERGVGLHEEGPAHGEVWELPGREGVVAGGLLEEVEVHWLVGDRQRQLLAHIGT